MSQSDAHQGSPRRQRGFLLMTAVILIVVIGLLATVITFLSTGNVLSSAGHANSAQALFLAESGIEFEQLRLAQNLDWYRATSDPTPNPATPQNLGAGIFTPQHYLPATALRTRVNPASVAVRVYTTDRFPTAGCLRVEDEFIAYTGVGVCGGQPCFTGITRAAAACGGGAAVDHTRGTAVYPVTPLQTAMAANCNPLTQILIVEHTKFLTAGTIKIGNEEIGYRSSSISGVNRILTGITRCLDTTTGPPGNAPEAHAIGDRVTPVMVGDDSVDYEAEAISTGAVNSASRVIRKTVQR